MCTHIFLPASVESSVCELGDITPDETKDFDVVVVGAGAAGVPAAGWAAELGGHVALLQKQSIVVSQGNCGSAIIKSKSTDAGKKMWVHMTNGDVYKRQGPYLPEHPPIQGTERDR